MRDHSHGSTSAGRAAGAPPRCAALALAVALAATWLVASGLSDDMGVARAAGGTVAAEQAELDLDLRQLVDGLTNTSAIGLFAKASIKGKADHLLSAVESYHGGAGAHTLEQYRERYDLLVNKVLVMLQGRDDELAERIAASRDALWAHMADAERFAALTQRL